MINWHKKIMKAVMKKFHLTTYDISMIAFIEGILSAVIVYEFIL